MPRPTVGAVAKSRVLHDKNIADAVVAIALDIIAPGFGIIRPIVHAERTIVPVIQSAKIELTGVFTSRGFNQPVERVVDVEFPWFDDGVDKKFGWDGGVEYLGNVADRVIGITEVLQDRVIRPG